MRTGEYNDSTTIKRSRNAMHGLTTNLKEEEIGSLGELSTVCSQIVVKCLYLARIGSPDVLWSVNKLARAVTELTKACDKRLARLVSYIHHTRTGNAVMWEIRHKNADQDWFKTLILQETLKTRSQHQVEFSAFQEAEHLCQQVGCARNEPQFHTVLRKLK